MKMQSTFTKNACFIVLFLLESVCPLLGQQPASNNAQNIKLKPPCALFAKYPRKVHAVLVGISDYVFQNQLSFCHKDAKAINRFLLSENANEQLVGTVTLLTNENATKEKIMNAVSEMSRDAQADDMLIFFFSGHGGKEGLTHYKSTGDDLITYQWLKETLRKSKAQMKMMILDACHSGASTDAGYIGAVSDLLNNQYNKSLCMITASQSGEASLENEKLGLGYFTEGLLRGLRGGLGGTKYIGNGDNCVTLKEAFDFAKAHVGILTRGKQTPTLSGDVPTDYVMWWQY
jgi:uncharacterized caspase-like protein